ncbi:MAG: universal stress protein [Acidobacteriota bacterium]
MKPGPVVQARRPARLREFLEDAGWVAGLAEHDLPVSELGLSASGRESRKIVAVSTESEFPAALIRHALGVAGRLGTEVVALSVSRSEPEGSSGASGTHAQKARELFEQKAEKSAGEFSREAREAGVTFRHLIRFGRVADVVEQECARLRRVEFVLAVKEQRGRDGFHVSMPLFEVIG